MVWTIIIVLGILIDQISKWFALKELAGQPPVPVIENFFYLDYYVNTGAAWSFLSNKSWGIYILSAISLIASVVFIYWLNKIKDRRLRLCLSLIIAGTIGNAIDRVFRGGVIDFVSLHFGNYAFPVFNIADSLLVIGIILLIIALLFTDSKHVLETVSPDAKTQAEKSEEDVDGMD